MKINGVEFTIGADPEIFMSINGKFVSAHNAVPGTKARPHKVEKGAVQVDGMALEFNIDPSKDYEEFVSNLTVVQQQLLKMLPEGAEFLPNSTMEFDEIFLKNTPIRARSLGCEPDYNAYTLGRNTKPDKTVLFRTVGGHIHTGGLFTDNPFGNEHMSVSARLARLMDEQIGVYSLLWDKDDKRRSLYGQAGAFRPKYYGMEYRSLSNAWLFSKEATKFVYDGVVSALELLFDPTYEPNPEISMIINNSDRSHPIFNTPKALMLQEKLK
jgi:hypothetical protein